MQKGKGKFVGVIVGEVIFALALIGFGIASAFVDEDTAMFCYVMMVATAIALFAVVILHIVTTINEKKRIANLNDPSSLAHKLFSENSEYEYFAVIPNRAAQTARNAVANTVGVLSMVVLGGGVFTWGKNALDAFVSQDELVLNSKNNPTFSDEKLQRFPASAVQDIQFVTKGKYERVQISFANSSESLVLDVNTSKCGAQKVRDSFSKLLRREAEVKPFEEFPAAN